MKDSNKEFPNPHKGESLTSFLKEKGNYEEISSAASQNVIAWMRANLLSKKTDSQ